MKQRTRISFHSGIIPFPIYTKPSTCGGKCIFCPKDEKYPNSYISNYDTRSAKKNNYSPTYQSLMFLDKLKRLKIYKDLPFEIIILGGSFSSLGNEYRKLFIQDLYNAMAFSNTTFDNQSPWENSPHKSSVVTVESRPDQITHKECMFLRYLGVTKVEIGVQHLDDNILNYNNRGHTQIEIIKATKLLKSEGFKVGYHIMFGLPGSKFKDDYEMVRHGLWREEYSPDYLKVYPCVLLKNRKLQPELNKLYDDNKWKPLAYEEYRELINTLGISVPSFVRISRIQRQFEQSNIKAGTRFINDRSKECNCIRCHEVGKLFPKAEITDFKNIKLRMTQINKDIHVELLGEANILLGITRIYCNDNIKAMIRELRIYGEVTEIGKQGKIQGQGMGKYLLKIAEEIIHKRGIRLIQINAGIGVRNYFIKRGYVINKEGYLEKSLKDIHTVSPFVQYRRILLSDGREGPLGLDNFQQGAVERFNRDSRVDSLADVGRITAAAVSVRPIV